MLVEQGHEAEHVIDLDLHTANDSVIWTYSLMHGAIVLTKDENFSNRHRQSLQTPVVVWLRVGNVSRSELLKWFSLLLPSILSLVEQGNRLIELRR